MGKVGPKRALNAIFGDFNSNFSGFRQFTGNNDCAYQIQHANIFKIANFQTGAKSELPSVIINVLHSHPKF